MDDTDLIVTSSMHMAREVISQRPQSLVVWNGLLHMTGGVLVPEKMFLVLY